MIIYSNTKDGFINDSINGELIPSIDNAISRKFHRTGRSEINSWRNSLMYMVQVVQTSGIPNHCGIAIEYMIPTTSKRIDFIVTGYDEKSQSQVIIIELKQWDYVEVNPDKKDIVRTYLGGGMREVAHPAYQVQSYKKFLYDYNEKIRETPIFMHPCVFMHNYSLEPTDDLLNPEYSEVVEKTNIYDSRGIRPLAAFINRFVKRADNLKVLYEIEGGRIRPSKSLQNEIANLVLGNTEFTMLDEQKVVYEEVISLYNKCAKDNKKRCLIVQGGPGTGKSVLAIQLLSYFTNQELLVHYITKNSAPREVYKGKLKGNLRMSSIDELFHSSGQYVELAENTLDVALVDEAHRLNEKSGFFANQGENQIKEIINSSLLSVFFIDESQRVTIRDIGTVNEIKKQADKLNCIIEMQELVSQFRCNGSEGYLAWLDDVLEINETANKLFDFDYDFGIVDDPNLLLKWVTDKNKENKTARVLAGYCWEWPKAERANPDYKDIQLPDYNFSMSWNLNIQTPWAIDEDSLYEAGCIHTVQGLEFDYIGVIIGDDMRYENGRIVTDFEKRAKSDQSLKGIKTINANAPHRAQKIADEIIKNTYRTLLTRGMKGCRVFCTDKKLANYLKLRASNFTYSNDYSDGGLLVAEDETPYEYED
jgi:DUF2075 family protein